MDELDKKIISELNKDSRLSFRELSKNLNIAVGTISHRIKKMEEDGIIKGYIPVVEPSKAGYDLIAVINVTIKRGKLQDVASFLINLIILFLFIMLLGTMTLSSLQDLRIGANLIISLKNFKLLKM